jgi:hypothetical protein
MDGKRKKNAIERRIGFRPSLSTRPCTLTGGTRLSAQSLAPALAPTLADRLDRLVSYFRVHAFSLSLTHGTHVSPSTRDSNADSIPDSPRGIPLSGDGDGGNLDSTEIEMGKI